MELIPLHDVPKGSKIYVEHLGLSYKEDGAKVETLTFHHIDGMYSYCTDDQGRAVHLRLNTPVRIKNDDK